MKSESEVDQTCPTLSDSMDCSLPWDFPGKGTGVECHCLLRLFPGANPSPLGHPREQTPVDESNTKVEIKAQLKPRGDVAKEENPKPSHK